MPRKRANLSDLLNNLTFKVIYNKYKLIALNAFEWEGLPDGVLERHIEQSLFMKGKAIFFKDPNMSHMVLDVQDGYGVDVHGDPLTYRAYGLNYNKEYDREDCVIIENNKMRYPTDDFIMFFANKLTEAERTMDVNIKACKTPIIMTCDDKDVLSFKRIFQMVDGNVPAIYADKNLNPDSIQALDTKAKFMGIELMDYKKMVENDCLTFLGLNNAPVEKKERLITDEANSNNELIQSFCDLQLEARERACEAINSMYALNVSVHKRQCGNVDNSFGGDDDVRV